MKVRRVHLHGGPYDGTPSIVSHFTAVKNGEVYVWDGSEDLDSFTHARTVVDGLCRAQREQELKHVGDCMERIARGVTMSLADIAAATGIPQWRVNLWYQLIRYGIAA